MHLPTQIQWSIYRGGVSTNENGGWSGPVWPVRIVLQAASKLVRHKHSCKQLLRHSTALSCNQLVRIVQAASQLVSCKQLVRLH